MRTTTVLLGALAMCGLCAAFLLTGQAQPPAGTPTAGRPADDAQQAIRRAVAAYDEYVAEMARIKDAEAPLTAEYVRRGGWQRYFLVTSSDGHVHRGMNCSTCRWETVYAWLIDLADCDEAKMVAEYGEKACTVCFPDAPTMDGWAESVAARLAEEAKIAEAFCPQGGQFQSAPAGHGWAKYVKCDHCGTTVSRTSTGKVRKHKKPEAA